ncbi:MAG: MmcQ/YjbR family DNA-binding protein [Verrucomicrobia bacterium]|nr:MmcQ/YjbR family DNA-binding protein [Verrucomicrobiota bacterium]
MPASLQRVRELALALPGVEEGVCFGTPAFYCRRKLMLRLRDEDGLLVVKYPREQREDLIAGQPDVFSVTEHYLNYPCVLLDLAAVDEPTLRRMIEGAWRMLASRKQQAAWDARG